jgi:hypothetical protein
MNVRYAFFSPLWLIPLLLTLNSCIGVSADISVRADGSGKIVLEYRVSHMAESLGRLDGNERWHTVPVGRADFERSLERLPGLRLISFSEKNNRTDIINTAELEFKTIDALLAFLDGGGTYTAFSRESGKNRLRLVLLEGQGSALDKDLLALLREVSAAYTISISLAFSGAAALVPTDGDGKAIDTPPAARLIQKGKKVSLSIGTGDLISLPGGLGMEIEW